MDVSEALAAQGLDAADLAANRVGRISERQLARQIAVRRSGGRGVWMMAVFGLAAGVGIGVWRLVQADDAVAAVVMSALGVVLAAIPLGVYYGFRFADPAKVAACTVVPIANAEVGAFLPAPARWIYAIALNGRRYSGFASALTRAHLGARVNAYVVEDHSIVVALEPVD